MPVMLPLTPGDTDYTFGTTLNEEVFLLRFRWSFREECWYLDLSDENDEPLASGVKVVLGTRLGELYASADMPRGYLVLVDNSGSEEDPTLDDIGVRLQLYFYTPDEI